MYRLTAFQVGLLGHELDKEAAKGDQASKLLKMLNQSIHPMFPETNEAIINLRRIKYKGEVLPTNVVKKLADYIRRMKKNTSIVSGPVNRMERYYDVGTDMIPRRIPTTRIGR